MPPSVTPPRILTNAVALFGQQRLSPNSNRFSITTSRSEHDVSTFEGVGIGTDKSAHLWAKGAFMEDFSFMAYAANEQETAILQSLASDSDPQPVMFFAGNAAVGDYAQVTLGEVFTANFSGEYDTPYSYEVQGRCSGDKWQAAFLLLQSLTTAPLEATGNAAGVEVGALAAGYELVADLVLPTVPGIAGTSSPTLTVTIESDEDEYFLYPTTRVSFAARTTTGAERVVIDGDDTPITDTYWRAVYTISGTDPEFSPVVAMSIRPKIFV